MKKALPVLLLALVLAGCAPAVGETPVPTAVPPETEPPAPTPEPAPAPKGPVADALELFLDEGCWSARFWIFPGTGPLPVELPQAEYGDALRELFAAYDWREITYEESRPDEDLEYPPDAYSFQLLCGYPAPEGPGPQSMGVASYHPYLQMGIKKADESYGSRYFTAQGAEALCGDIADLWSGWEAVTGCCTRVAPQETQETLARTYLEATFDKLKVNGHIQDARIDSLELILPVYDGESVESDYMTYDDSVALQFKTIFSLKPTRPELSYWQEQRVDEEGWVRFELSRISLSLSGDGLYELGWFEYPREG